MPQAREGRLHVLQTISTNGGTWGIALVTDPLVIDLDTVWGDLTEATFPGYTPQTLSWDSPAINGDGDAQMNPDDTYSFERTSTGTPETVYHAVLYQDDSGTKFLYDWITFSVPLVFQYAGDAITITDWKFRQGAMILP